MMGQVSAPFSCPTQVQDYELLELIGTGAFAFVYKARLITSQQEGENEEFIDSYFAIKVIPKNKLVEPGDEERLQREIDTMTLLIHESIVALHKSFVDDENYYLVMDLCSGGTVFTYILSGNRLREPQAATIFRQICEAIEFCHNRGIAHRDLKLQNILFTTFPNIKVSDFGLCGYISDDTKMSTFCGSPCYSAPECINHVDYDGKLADIWSLGVILFELVTSSHPWNVSNVAVMVQQICKAQYTIPAFVTSACADLIDSLLKVKSEERIDIDSIMAHPWMKIAAKKPSFGSGGFRSCLPPLKRTPSTYAEKKGGLTEKGDDSSCLPHSTINMINPAHFDMTPKPRQSFGKTFSGPSRNILQRRTSYSKSDQKAQAAAAAAVAAATKKAHDSVDPANLSLQIGKW
ncbi:CAMK family protein kinase [Tritrichomonas foetus]|uniref:CAMK family protein kinase n=1 Tax=Tritrichomonas foetus TaxID=1144522 RepID=A0A1J4K7V4_9EUKA|nr:CAMK family protein kinase [Tritrichomonas foetus]|eukprot:OHT05796.1 CAMK family protein kinase [Tritrichomonas foetus]